MIKRQRSTFSPTNALKFKRIFDTAIKHEQDLLIPVKGSVGSFQTKCSDALKWLITYNDDEHLNSLNEKHPKNGYATLRGKIRMKCIIDPKDKSVKIHISFFKNELHASGYECELISATPTKDEQVEDAIKRGEAFPDLWKKKLIDEFIQGSAYRSDKTKVFKLKGLNLTEDDLQWATSMLSQLGESVTFSVDTDLIVASYK